MMRKMKLYEQPEMDVIWFEARNIMMVQSYIDPELKGDDEDDWEDDGGGW